MSGITQEQRNPYKGAPLRPWISLRLIASDGTEQPVDLMADTGNPNEIIVSESLMHRFGRRTAVAIPSNFGMLIGGWLRVAIPEVGFVGALFGYASDPVSQAAKMSCPDFEGMVGLPLLRRFVYGGDAQSFWLFPVGGTP